MDTTQGKTDLTKSAKKGAKRAARAAERVISHEKEALQESVGDVRDLVEDLRERAEIAFHERPYLLPVATGALGLGVGVLIGSKLSRVLFMAAAGAMLSDQFRGQLVRVSRQLLNEIGDPDDSSAKEREAFPEEIEDIEPSVT